ncbi:MAG: thioredoxin domain-containing protein [Anaerolineae bacterium]|jgi:protein-disulfide isomerase
MPSKRRKARRRAGKRRAAQKKRYALVAGVVVVALIAVAALVLLDQGAGSSRADAGAEATEKSLGAPDAPVVVVEYADFQCPYCRQFAEGPGQQLKADYVESGQVRLVFRHLAFLGDESTWAAEAAECANEQDRFWDYHDKLFDEQAGENRGAYSRDNLKRFAADLELDSAQFDECFDSGKYRAVVQAEFDDARLRRINSTPTILVDGELIRNGANYQVLQAAVEAALRGQ